MSAGPGAGASAAPGALQAWFPVLFVVLWSTGFIGARLGGPHAEPLTFLSVRFIAVIAILSVVVALRGTRLPRGADLRHAALVGLLVHGGYLSGVFIAIHQGMPAGIAALIVGCQPVLTALVAARLFAEPLTARRWLGIALGFAGLCLVVLPGLLATHGAAATPLAVGAVALQAEGVLLCLMSLFSITAGTLYQKRHAQGVGLLGGALVQYAAVLAVLGPLSLLLEQGRIDWTGEFVVALAWLVLVLSIGAIFLLMAIIRRGSVVNTASLFYLVPPLTAVVAWALFGDRLGWLTVLGIAVSCVGVALVNRRPRAPRAATPEQLQVAR